MRKSILIFTAVLVAGAFAHAFADDMTSLDSGVETARAARLGAPSAPATPAAAQPNQSDARGGATQSTGGAQGLRALPVPATTPSTASGPARAPIAGRDTPGAPTDTGTSTREISNRAATVQPIARTAITPSTSDNRIISTRTSVTAGPDTGRATATVAPVSTDQTAQTRVAIAPVHGTGAAPTMPVVSRTSPNARATGDKPSAMGRSAIQLSRSAKKAAPIPDDQRDFTTCHDTYFQCMDEFCANKDAQLKRCACSSRVHDFDKQKKQMDNFSNKMLDFNENLLTVSMNASDAASVTKATAGEKAYDQTKDTSKSQTVLNNIMDSLKPTTNTGNTAPNTASMNSLNTIGTFTLDSNATDPFDTVDAMLGADTTTKTGVALYNAALPGCREMAAEVCTADDASTVAAAYQMAIETDCNTVAKTYASIADAANQQVTQANALLDMSRLNNYQTRNSDDILTCKQKMLDQLSDNAVCGADLGKCLDWSGKYIDPSTGAPILESDLSNLTSLITPPAGNSTWVKTPGNEKFVAFLNAKKKYLTPAMANCQAIADKVWNMFLEDALGQIKLAQNKKLEDLRQGCTTLTTKCLSGTATSITDFDARALTIFGVAADTAMNKMCGDVKLACNNLMAGTGGGEDWNRGMTDIAAQKTYAQIMETCTQVGKTCITQNCNNYVGNFGLCMKNGDAPRNNIMNRNICWDDVKKCVMGANGVTTDPKTLQAIVEQNPADFDIGSAYSFCLETDPKKDPGCAITQRIWGTCNFGPQDPNNAPIINKVSGYTTLLAWLGGNTANNFSCQGNPCGPGETTANGTSCVNAASVTSDGEYCDASKIYITANWTNCCATKTDSFGNCCTAGSQSVPVDVTKTVTSGTFRMQNASGNGGKSTICASGNVQYIASYSMNGRSEYLFCNGIMNYSAAGNGTPMNANCSGKLFVIDATTGLYSMPMEGYTLTAGAGIDFNITHYIAGHTSCPIAFTGGAWAYTSAAPTSGCMITLPFTKSGNTPPRVFINAGN